MSAMIGGSCTARMPGRSTIAPTASRGADGRCDQLVDVGDEEPLELRQVQGPLFFLGLDTAVERAGARVRRWCFCDEVGRSPGFSLQRGASR
jgi:hypothetical protein